MQTRQASWNGCTGRWISNFLSKFWTANHINIWAGRKALLLFQQDKSTKKQFWFQVDYHLYDPFWISEGKNIWWLKRKNSFAVKWISLRPWPKWSDRSWKLQAAWVAFPFFYFFSPYFGWQVFHEKTCPNFDVFHEKTCRDFPTFKHTHPQAASQDSPLLDLCSVTLCLHQLSSWAGRGLSCARPPRHSKAPSKSETRKATYILWRKAMSQHEQSSL